MKLYTHITGRWNGTAYVTVESESAWTMHEGPVLLCCGASAAQNSIQSQQQTAYSTMTSQASQVFGNNSAVFNDLQNTFAPTVAAGPSQKGFSAGEVSNLNSAAITGTGQAYRNEKAAVGDAQSAVGGGNLGDVSTGATAGTNAALAVNAGNQTASAENQIQQADYAQGNTNYNNATKGLADATGVFNSSTSAGNAATGAGGAAAGTANQIANQNNSWMQAVSGVLGQVGGAMATGGMSMLGNAMSAPSAYGPSTPQGMSLAATGGSGGPLSTTGSDTSNMWVS